MKTQENQTLFLVDSNDSNKILNVKYENNSWMLNLVNLNLDNSWLDFKTLNDVYDYIYIQYPQFNIILKIKDTFLVTGETVVIISNIKYNGTYYEYNSILGDSVENVSVDRLVTIHQDNVSKYLSE